jgi:hypothetical protein
MKYSTYGKLPIMLCSRKQELEKMEAHEEHAADTCNTSGTCNTFR